MIMHHAMSRDYLFLHQGALRSEDEQGASLEEVEGSHFDTWIIVTPGISLQLHTLCPPNLVPKLCLKISVQHSRTFKVLCTNNFSLVY